MSSKSLSETLPIELAQFDNLPDSAYVRLPVVRALHGISSSTVWRWVRAGIIPAPAKRGRTTGWCVGDLRRSLSANASRSTS